MFSSNNNAIPPQNNNTQQSQPANLGTSTNVALPPSASSFAVIPYNPINVFPQMQVAHVPQQNSRQDLTILSWNIQWLGGRIHRPPVRPASQIEGIAAVACSHNPDVIVIQEVMQKYGGNNIDHCKTLYNKIFIPRNRVNDTFEPKDAELINTFNDLIWQFLYKGFFDGDMLHKLLTEPLQIIIQADRAVFSMLGDDGYNWLINALTSFQNKYPNMSLLDIRIAVGKCILTRSGESQAIQERLLRDYTDVLYEKENNLIYKLNAKADEIQISETDNVDTGKKEVARILKAINERSSSTRNYHVVFPNTYTCGETYALIYDANKLNTYQTNPGTYLDIYNNSSESSARNPYCFHLQFLNFTHRLNIVAWHAPYGNEQLRLDGYEKLKKLLQQQSEYNTATVIAADFNCTSPQQVDSVMNMRVPTGIPALKRSHSVGTFYMPTNHGKKSQHYDHVIMLKAQTDFWSPIGLQIKDNNLDFYSHPVSVEQSKNYSDHSPVVSKFTINGTHVSSSVEDLKIALKMRISDSWIRILENRGENTMVPYHKLRLEELASQNEYGFTQNPNIRRCNEKLISNIMRSEYLYNKLLRGETLTLDERNFCTLASDLQHSLNTRSSGKQVNPRRYGAMARKSAQPY